MTSKATRARLRELLATIPEGPYTVDSCGFEGYDDARVENRHGCTFAESMTTTEAELVATALNELPALLDALDEAERVLEGFDDESHLDCCALICGDGVTCDCAVRAARSLLERLRGGG